jgi:acyl-CoA synthetase (AMP-forming)/AMP-acid ligase II
MDYPDFPETLRAHAPDAPALSLLSGLREEFRWTFGQLQQSTAGFGRALRAAGIESGCSVCMVAGNCPQFIALFLACIDLGCTFVPLHPDQPVASVSNILRDMRPALLIIEEDLPESLLRAVLRAKGRVWRLRIRRTPWLRPVLSRASRGRQSPGGADASAENPPADGANASPANGMVDSASANAAIDAADGALPALVLHSSGSTGAPKVIQYSRERLNIFLHWQRLLFDAFPDAPGTPRPSPRVNALPLAHFGGLSFVLQGLLDGRLVHLPRTIAPYDYLRLAVREHCQLLMLVPALYEALLDDAAEALPRSNLRYCLTMGEAVTPQLVDLVTRALDVKVCSAYGMSEGLSGLAHHGADPPPDSCGRLLFGEARLVDGNGAEAPAEGELWVRNATTFPCYRDPRLNAAKFVDGWYRTGDRFRRDTRGHYYFVERVDAMCVIIGRNVYPAELEQVLLRHPEVSDCMAAVLALDSGRKRLGVLVCLQPGSRATPAGLVDWFLEHGALHAVPAWLLLGKGIPRNAAGKRDRLVVAKLLREDYSRCLRKVS